MGEDFNSRAPSALSQKCYGEGDGNEGCHGEGGDGNRGGVAGIRIEYNFLSADVIVNNKRIFITVLAIPYSI